MYSSTGGWQQNYDWTQPQQDYTPSWQQNYDFGSFSQPEQQYPTSGGWDQNYSYSAPDYGGYSYQPDYSDYSYSDYPDYSGYDYGSYDSGYGDYSDWWY
jgi:hypothetical protein